MEVAVTTKDGKDTGRKVKLHKSIFGITPNDHAIYLDVKQFLANQRQGTHKTKERSEVVGSTKKIKRQKGTGTARAGSIKSPIFRGGGTVFGPRPRDYGFKLNKKLKKLARRSALSYKAKEKDIFILEDVSFEAPKTKDYALMLKQNKLEGTKTLFVLPEADKNLILSSRNIQKTKVLTAEQLNTYELVNADKLVLFEGAIKRIEELLK